MVFLIILLFCGNFLILSLFSGYSVKVQFLALRNLRSWVIFPVRPLCVHCRWISLIFQLSSLHFLFKEFPSLECPGVRVLFSGWSVCRSSRRTIRSYTIFCDKYMQTIHTLLADCVGQYVVSKAVWWTRICFAFDGCRILKCFTYFC